MKRALITGGAGFIAHHLISQILKSTDWEVVTLDRLDFSGNLNRLQDVLKDFPAEERARVKIVFHDLKAAVNPLIAADIGKYQKDTASASLVNSKAQDQVNTINSQPIEISPALQTAGLVASAARHVANQSSAATF